MKFIPVFILLFLSGICFAGDKIFYSDGARNLKKIALSFDDGPGANTEKILEILKEKGVKATFFMMGSKVVKNPKTAKQVAEEGHEIANHTYGHINFYTYDGENKREKIESELMNSHEVIQNVTGIKPFLVRYPHGYSRPDAIETARKNGYYVINWTFGCDWDFKLSSEELYEKYVGAIKNGGLFLMHDTNTKAAAILAGFIDTIKDKGYEIVTVGEILDLQKTPESLKK